MVDTRTTAAIAALLRLGIILLCACSGVSLAADFTDDVRKIVEADQLLDGTIPAGPSGWRTGRAPFAPSPGSVPCPSPIGYWPLRHAYRNAPGLRAEIWVLSLPWLSPVDVRAIRDGIWVREGGAEVVAGSHTSAPSQPERGGYESDGWLLKGAGETFFSELLVRPWPEGNGTFALGACAPVSNREEIRRELLAVATSLVPNPRTGLDVAVERAQDLRDACAAWRYTLPPAETQARVAQARAQALAALRAPSTWESNVKALHAVAGVVALDALGIEAGKGYDAAAVSDLLAKAGALDDKAPAPTTLYGRALLDTGNAEGALKLLESRAAGLPRPDALLLYLIGEARWELGRKEQAVETWRRARATLDQDRRFSLTRSGPLGADIQRRQAWLSAVLDARLK